MSDPRTPARRQALEDQERSLRREMDELGADPDLDEVAFDADVGFSDRSHSTEERGRVIATTRALRASLRDVERARSKVADGTYGVCERCGKTVGQERLDAMPWALLCIDCKKLVG
ncbi:MAG: TraR/DksA family transcriptional regulator [Actinomycetota bacterium]